MAIGDVTAEAVHSALQECDSLGRESFLQRYGFKEARTYVLSHDGKDYDSKAIFGVAHRYATGEQLSSKDFYGGKERVVPHLRKLGFTVKTGAKESESDSRNPSWNRDEIILALDLYMTNPTSPPGKGSKAVADLSALLNRLSELAGIAGNERYRNENGVYLKMMNLRALDPAFTSQGKAGMKAGGALEKVIWDEYHGRHDDLTDDANAIRQAVEGASSSENVALPPIDAYEATEGGIVIRVHRSYERDARLIAKKKRAAKAAGNMACEVCAFDFAGRYGDLGSDFIEVHHTKPVHQMKPGMKTTLSDLALLCSNCHRMAHRKQTPLSLEELRVAIKR